MVTLPEISRSILSFFASSPQARQIGDEELAAMAGKISAQSILRKPLDRRMMANDVFYIPLNNYYTFMTPDPFLPPPPTITEGKGSATPEYA